jgi:hypothetical protein
MKTNRCIIVYNEIEKKMKLFTNDMKVLKVNVRKQQERTKHNYRSYRNVIMVLTLTQQWSGYSDYQT